MCVLHMCVTDKLIRGHCLIPNSYLHTNVDNVRAKLAGGSSCTRTHVYMQHLEC